MGQFEFSRLVSRCGEFKLPHRRIRRRVDLKGRGEADVAEFSGEGFACRSLRSGEIIPLLRLALGCQFDVCLRMMLERSSAAISPRAVFNVASFSVGTITLLIS